MKRTKGNEGITLIALVVTVIVLIILAAVTLNLILGSNGMITRTSEAAINTRGAQAQEEATLWKTDIAMATYAGGNTESLEEILERLEKQGILTEDEVKEIMKDENTNREIQIGKELISFKVEENQIVEEITIADLVDEEGNDDTKPLKVGNYVSYTPDTAGDYEIAATNSGAPSAQTIEQETFNWRILDIVGEGSNKQIRIISDAPTTKLVAFRNFSGYNNFVKILNDLCATHYSNSNMGTAQSLKIEDIQDKMKLSVWDYHNYTNANVNTGLYGGTKTYETNKTYPDIFASEINGKVDGVAGTVLGQSNQTDYVGGRTRPTTSIEITQTAWEKGLSKTNYKKDIYYTLFNKNTSDYPQYFLASRCINADTDMAEFCYYTVNGGNIDKYALYYSNEAFGPGNYRVRPIVTLYQDVTLDTSVPNKDGTTPDKAWVLKSVER